MRGLQPPLTYACVMPGYRPARCVVAGLTGVAAAVLLAACSSGPSTTDTTTSTTGATTTTSARASSTTSTSSGRPTTSTSSATSGTLAPQTSTETEFLSPSKNISCEIDNNFGPSTITQTLCLTFSPAQSAVLKTDGTVTKCAGQQCLSNPGENTPTLQYGQTISLGPFTCASSTAGMKCTLSNGDGFTIATSGITVLTTGGGT
jgi:hypothetical protein